MQILGGKETRPETPWRCTKMLVAEEQHPQPLKISHKKRYPPPRGGGVWMGGGVGNDQGSGWFRGAPSKARQKVTEHYTTFNSLKNLGRWPLQGLN